MAPPTPAAGSRNLVLGVIENYSFGQIAPFLLSLRQTGYAGEVVFFYHGIDRRSIEAIQGLGVELLPFRNARGASSGTIRHLLDRLSHRYHSWKWPWYEHGWRFLLSAAKLRYYLYHRFLQRNRQRFHRVLLVDTRDVFFQADPFAQTMEEDLVFFEEGHALNYGKINAGWLRSQFGQKTFDRLGSRTTLCAGTTMGTPDALCCYLERVMQTIRRAKGQDQPRGDQAVHNVVAYEELRDAPFSLRLCPNGAGPVYTLTQYVPPAEIRLSPRGEVVNAEGDVVPIVHQYDRHPDIARALLSGLGLTGEPFK
jgi:hypothetical protein